MKIVKISAIWCSSCIIMKSRFNDVLENNNNNIDIISLDYDIDNIDEYQVGDILPVYIKYENDKEIGRLVGEHSKKEIERFLM